MRSHFVKAHPAEILDTSQESILEKCSFRHLSGAEVRRIMNRTAEEPPPVEIRPFRRTEVDRDSEPDDDDEPGDVVARWGDPSRSPNVDRYKLLPSCVVRHADGTWIEPRCPICGRNTPTKTDMSSFPKGVTGFSSHISLSHHVSISVKNPEQVIDYCKYREFSDAEVDAICKGAPGAPTST